MITVMNKIKRVMAFLLCIACFMHTYEVQGAIELYAKEAGWDGEGVIYWNPGEGLDLATISNAARKIPKGSDRANGLSPDTPVKSLDKAISRAEKLSRQMDIKMTEVVIYAMNPMIIPPGKSCVVSGKEVTVMPWDGRQEDEKPIFIVDGGTLSLDHMILQPEYNGSQAESVLIYISSGTVQLGELAEVHGILVLDYTQPEDGRSAASPSDAISRVASPSDTNSQPGEIHQEPVIELTNWFDMVEGNYTLDLRIPEDRERDVIAVRTLHGSQLSADDFLTAFTVSKTTEDWEILAEGRVDDPGVSNASPSNAARMNEQSITHKYLIARRIPGIIPNSQISGRLWLDQNTDGVMEGSEQGISDYSISLFAADDRSTVVQTVKTQADGTYRFQNLKPGSYVVGMISETVDSRQYLLPAVGITRDNKFETTEISGMFAAAMVAGSEETVMAAYSEKAAITAEAAVSAPINGGLRLRSKRSLPNLDYKDLPLGGNVLKSGDQNKLVVMAADGDPAAGYYKSYAATPAGLRLALYDLYKENAAAVDYIIYLGADITVVPAAVFADTTSATGTRDVSFASLQGRVNTLVITGHQEDPVANTPAASAPTSCRRISLSGRGDRYFGSNIILRNIRHTFGTGTSHGVYMKGYHLTLGGNSWQTEATRYFGGSTSGTVTPSGGTASITVYSTGFGASHFIGGMRAGTLNGNAEITINNTSGNSINVWGGGLGPSPAFCAYITGRVTNTITGMSTRRGGLERFVGGLDYGAVNGRITNTISGRGRFSSKSSQFVGGSRYGNVGNHATLGGAVDTDDLSGLADTDDYIIKNRIDLGGYTYGAANYNGTNYKSGIVKGNVVNIVKAGSYSGGGYITSFSGGAGIGAVIGGNWSETFAVDSAAAKVTKVEAGLAAAKKASDYQLYGNISNVIREGCISSLGTNNYWFRGAGWGYMEGNAYSELGTEGLVYARDNNKYTYSTTKTNQGYRSEFDLVGGGGSIHHNNSFCIKGNTTLVTRNVLARWTYGGSFGGVQIGNSKISHHGGILDTCEGTGYRSYIHVGDGRAEVHGGQVDWFLCGGGWNDYYQDGNVSVEVFDRPNIIINASIGGTYGASASHMISGDSTVVVRGGNFSGTARYPEYRGFSAGPSHKGYILGNASVTLDLRGNRHGFSIEPSDSISGGRRFGSGTGGSYLGTDKNNTITLNIMTDDSQTDLLRGLNIYGDCANPASGIGNTRAGKITINVNAPGANIGNIYATDYPNLSLGVLRRDVEINLVSVKTLTGLRSGNGTEDITNLVARTSEAAGRRAVINVGPRSADPDHILSERETGETADGLPHRINIAANGILGFTAMNIQKRLLIAQSGNIKNGANATVANHGTDYQNFGTLTLQAGEGMTASGLGISSPRSVFIAGAALIEGKGEVYIQSTGQANQIVLTDLAIPDTSWMTWLKVGTVRPDTTLRTNWFGVNKGWRVITLNPDKTKAYKRITPVNFRGLEKAAGKVFIGDSDTHFRGNQGYVVAIPGSVYRWEVVEGRGRVSHNVPVTTTAPASNAPIKAYGTVPADTLSTQGSLAVPDAFIPDPIAYPEFKFIPEPGSGECVNDVNIYGSDRYSSSAPHNYRVERGETHQTKTWTAKGDDKEYSFDIAASFHKGDPPVQARKAVYVDGINGNDENAGDVPTEPVRTLEKTFQQLEVAGANVIYVVGTVTVSESAAITAAGYTALAGQVPLSAAPDHVYIRRFATPLAGDPNAGTLYNKKYHQEDFLGALFQVEKGADFTIGAGVCLDGHYYPKTGAEYANEFSVNRYLKVLSPLIQVESGGELVLQKGAQLRDNFNTGEPAEGETRMAGGAVHNSGKVKLSGAHILNNSAARGAGIYQNGSFEITLAPDGIKDQEIYLTTVNRGSAKEPVWEDHTVTAAVWLPADLKLNINMDHAVAGRPVVRYTKHTHADPQWGNYTLGETVPETLFLVENDADSSLLELQDWSIMDISVPDEIFLVIQQGRDGDIGVKRADSSGFKLASPAYKVKNGGSYQTKVSLTGFVNQNTSVGIDAYERMNLVASPSDAVGDTAGQTDLYLAIAGTDDGGGGFASLPETSLYDFNAEGVKQQVVGTLGRGEEAGFVFTGAASGSFMSYYMDRLFPSSGSGATVNNRIAHLRNKDPDTGEISGNQARAMFKMTYRVELIR